jgi:hypothetical protein
MERRTFLGMIAGGLLAAPLAAEAQQTGRSIASACWRRGLPFSTLPTSMLSDKG